MTTTRTTLTLEAAAECLRQGQVVAIPTETVYGLAGSIDHPAAIANIFALKQRPTHHPLIIHLADVAQLTHYATRIPDYVWHLAQHFWPGPLTLVLPKTAAVPTTVTGGQDTVAIRVPSHPLTRALLQHSGCALAAPSANPFGQLSPTRATHVEQYFSGQVPVLDGGPCTLGLESTIVDVTDATRVSLLRPGSLPTARLMECLATLGVAWEQQASNVRAPGKLHKHYAPRKPLFIVNSLNALGEVRNRVGDQLMLLHLTTLEGVTPWQVAMPTDPATYAQVLYHTLLEADLSNADAIVIEQPPLTSAWLAIHDRLSKASFETSQRFAIPATVL